MTSNLVIHWILILVNNNLVSHMLCYLFFRHLAAKLNNIFLGSIFYTKDRKQFENLAVFQEIIKDINILSSNGIVINVNGSEQKNLFRCVLLLGDNKGLNEMCGFCESFSGTRYCRLCTATSFECQAMCEENPLLLRNKENYDEDVESNNILSGIKERCIFNSFRISTLLKIKL